MTNKLEPLRIFLGFSERAVPWMPIIIGIFIATCIIRVGILGYFTVANPDFFYDDDSFGYVTLAENLEKEVGFSWDTEAPYTPNSYRTPAYPIFLLAHHMLFGNFVSALITQIVLAMLIAYLMIRIADRYLLTGVGVVAAGIFLFMPFSLLIPMKYATQVFFTATIMVAVWFWNEYLSKGNTKYLVLTSLLLPVVALIRPIAILIVVPLVVTLILARFWEKIPWKRVSIASAVLCIVFFLGIAPWLWRNMETFGHTSLSSLVPHQLYQYDAPAIYAVQHNISHTEAQQILLERIESTTGKTKAEYPDLYYQFSEITPIMMEEGIRITFEDPLALIESRVVQFGKFFIRDGIRNWLEPHGISTSEGVGFAMVVVERLLLAILTLGFFFASARAFVTKNIPLLFMTLIVLYFAVLTGVMAAAGLRYPAEPLFLILGVLGLCELYLLGKKTLNVRFNK